MASKARSFLLLFALAVHVAHGQWVNDFDGVLDFECPLGETISRVQSIHSNDKEDRVWAYECKALPINATDLICAYNNNVNDLDEPFDFGCPSNGFWVGAHSEHDNKAEDRVWSFKCCGDPEHCHTNCYFTPEVNDFDGPMDFTVDEGYYIAGISSYHDNGREDRRWKFFVCQVAVCIPPF